MRDTTFRDVLIALPERERADVYTEHQAVWRELGRLGVPVQPCGAAPFLFASDGSGLIQARVAHPLLRAPLSRPVESGRYRCRVLAATRHGQTARSVEHADLPGFVRALMARHGLQAMRIAIEDVQTRHGLKAGDHAITLHTAEAVVEGRFETPLQAHSAWITGIGRAKRFGCGMLRVA